MRSLLATVGAACAVIGAAVAAAGTAAAQESASVVMSMTVPSMTSIDAAECADGVAGSTSLTNVVPSVPVVSSIDCTIRFGSSNDSSQLRIAQADGRGQAMWMPTRGELDTQFSGDGLASTAVTAGTGADAIHALQAQPDGKLVAAGMCSAGATGLDICLARYDTDGSLDDSFGTDGTVLARVTTTVGTDAATALQLQPDGRIVVAGWCATGTATGDDLCLMRFLPDGTPDSSFGGDGIVTTAAVPAAAAESVSALLLQPDGRLVTAGYCFTGAATGNDLCLTRYEVNGELDTSFGNNGIVTTAVAPGAGTDHALALTMDANAQLVTAGYCDMGGSSGLDLCVARYGPDGALDTTFDADGVATVAVAPGTGADVALAMQATDAGSILVAGACSMGGATGTDACVARLTSDGAPDSSFATDGILTESIGPGTGADVARALQLGGDGTFLLAGDCAMGAATGLDICLARYSPSGVLDTAFGTQGIVTTSITPGSGNDIARSLVMQADGVVAVAGECDMSGSTGTDFCLTRYASGGSFDQYDDAAGIDWSASTAPSLFAVCLRGVADGASALWTTHATCAPTDGPHWNAIPEGPANIAAAASATATAAAHLRFGLRAGTSQPTGTYTAPIILDVIAPNV